MRIVKKYFLLSGLVFFYVSLITMLLHQVSIYQKAYYELSKRIAHSSIEVKIAEEE